ncbi:Fic family protein [Paenibacillus sp. 19GGS1-52]|uniref:Fic family protein n=1 Tax=Paenibacillus sp. 19GGS1-52 TaxID=2758563 RepID=UPI001EFB0D98|nr:Fic family protein [Paenibacillus sp. 19GGS1-52]ULO06269.1 Fic family protein [Paenibacillus sp. 19GGS1-52]
MSSYDPNRLNKVPQFTAVQGKQLREVALKLPLSDFLMNYRNVEELGIDFVYSSAKLVGNEYSLVDGINLLKLGVTAAGKLYSDAKMLLNLWDAYNFVLTLRGKALERYLVSDIHSILSRDILPDSSCGIPREDSILICGGGYSLPMGKDYLNEELDRLLNTALTIDNPFERAIYLKLNLCYLQYFQDVNKRTARMVQTLSLLNSGVMPLLSGYEESSGYLEAISNYCNTGSYGKYMSWFVSSYRQMVNNLTYQPKITKSRSFDLRKKDD